MVASSKTWYTFTDAWYEPTSRSWPCGIGGLIYDPFGRPVEFFSLVLDHIKCLGGDSKETIAFDRAACSSSGDVEVVTHFSGVPSCILC